MHTPHILSTHKQRKKGIILSAIATVSQSLDGILFRLHLFNQKNIPPSSTLHESIGHEGNNTNTHNIVAFNRLCVCVTKSALLER